MRPQTCAKCAAECGKMRAVKAAHMREWFMKCYTETVSRHASKRSKRPGHGSHTRLWPRYLVTATSHRHTLIWYDISSSLYYQYYYLSHSLSDAQFPRWWGRRSACQSAHGVTSFHLQKGIDSLGAHCHANSRRVKPSPKLSAEQKPTERTRTRTAHALDLAFHHRGAVHLLKECDVQSSAQPVLSGPELPRDRRHVNSGTGNAEEAAQSSGKRVDTRSGLSPAPGELLLRGEYFAQRLERSLCPTSVRIHFYLLHTACVLLVSFLGYITQWSFLPRRLLVSALSLGCGPSCAPSFRSTQDYSPVPRAAAMSQADVSTCSAPQRVFQEAVKKGNTKELHSLLQNMTNCEFNVNSFGPEGQTALHQSVIDGNLELVKLLVKFGADIRLANREGWSALHIAAFGGTRTLYYTSSPRPSTRLAPGDLLSVCLSVR
ncbi:hypothetical protein WMY93_021562 [Mugilogobius chulae]|uniref:NOTCH-regulated ankyrin repeat protein n=1 Tax=Mugilogobius chulae TaxID=88201 RepID=A0AAW0NLJ6_9GOBI